MAQQWVVDNYTSPALPASEFNSDVSKLLDLYPDNPALGAPFGTGNDTFGLSPEFKRMAAIEGDMGFHAKRRELVRLYASINLPAFAYLFTEPQPELPPFAGGQRIYVRSFLVAVYSDFRVFFSWLVTHGTEMVYVFGAFENLTTPAQVTLSKNIIDYWVSFVTSLDPNDAHGNTSRMQDLLRFHVDTDSRFV